MKIKLGWKVILGLFIMIMAFGLKAQEIDLVIKDAQTKAASGDIEGAATAYHKVLKIDNANEEARRGLADAVIQGYTKDPHSEQPDFLNTIGNGEDIHAALFSTEISHS
jgi:predicted TPR repeat methyltransferase